MEKAKTVKIKVKKSHVGLGGGARSRARNAVTMEAVETDLTLNEEGLDAVAGFLKSVADREPAPRSL